MNIKVMSFNVKCKGEEENAWTERRRSLVSLIYSYMPDIVGFQEATPSWMEYLDKALKRSYNHVGIGRKGGNEGEYSPIFYKANRFVLNESDTFWISETPNEVSKGWDAACNRICTYGVFTTARGKQFAVCNTHLDHRGELARRNGSNMVREKLESFDIPAVLMGDFNYAEDDPNYRLMITDKVGDAKYLTKDSDNHYTFNNFGREGSDFGKVIDHIFVLKHKIKVPIFRVITDMRPNGLYISDHFPIMARIEF